MLRLAVLDASLETTFGSEPGLLDDIKTPGEKPIPTPEANTCLSFRVRLVGERRVILANGEELDGLGGWLTIYPMTEPWNAQNKGIGVLSFLEDEPADDLSVAIPASYSIDVAVPNVQFRDLVAAARLGRIPSEVTVSERGMKSHDEFSKKWDTQSAPHLHGKRPTRHWARLRG